MNDFTQHQTPDSGVKPTATNRVSRHTMTTSSSKQRHSSGSNSRIATHIAAAAEIHMIYKYVLVRRTAAYSSKMVD